MTPQSRDPKYIALLAVAAGTILLVGNLIRPGRQGPEGIANVPTQAERVRLQRLAQKASLEDTVAYFAQIAGDVARHVVRLGPAHVSGIVWDSEGLVVSSRTKGRFPATLQFATATAEVTADTVVDAPGAALVAVRARSADPLTPARRLPVVLPYSGESIVAVWRSEDRRHAFAPGLFLGLTSSLCGSDQIEEMLVNLPLTAAMAGGGLFDQEGRLLSVIAYCGDRHAAIGVETVTREVTESVSFEGRLLTRFGMRATSLSPAEARHFGVESGALIREVWNNHPADAAGLRPGDLIVELEGQPAHTTEELHGLVMPVAREVFELRIVRWKAPRRITLPVRSLSPPGNGAGPGAAGVVLASPSQAWRVASVLPGSPAERAGIEAGDQLLEIDGRAPVSESQVRRALEITDDRARFVALARGDRRWGVLLAP